MSDTAKLLSKYLFLPLTTIFLIVLFYFHYTESKRILSVDILSSQDAEEVFISAPPTADLLSSRGITLLYNGYPLPYDTESGTYYLSQNMNHGDWQGALSLSCTGGELYFLEDALLFDKSAAISSGHAFSLCARIGNSSQLLSLVITGLPLISMTSAGSETPVYDPDLEPDKYYYDSQTRYYGAIVIFNANPKSGKCQTVFSPVTFHERGASSTKYGRKKNYAIKLLEEDGTRNEQYLFDIGTNAKWKLITMFNDSSKIRDMTSLTLWNEIAAASEADFMEYSAEMSYCEVFLDGRYNGLCGVLSPIDEDTLHLKDEDSLYKLVEFGNPSPEGFQYSLDNNFTIAHPVRLRYPEDPEKILSGWMPMQEYLTYAYWTPNAYAYASLLDLRNIADFYIFTQATAAADNRSKNTYMVSRRQPDGRYITYILPWDLNYTFGEIWAQEPEKLYVEFDEDPTVIYVEPCIRQLFDENIYGADDLLKQRYLAYRADILSEDHIIAVMEENMNLLIQSGALARDTAICPDSGNSADLTATKQFVRERMAFLDEYFLN